MWSSMEVQDRGRLEQAKVRALTVALSVSRAEDLGRFGLRPTHLDAIFSDLARGLLEAGVRLAYGSAPRAGCFSARLVELAQEVPSSGLLAYPPWPTRGADDGAALGPFVEVRAPACPPDVEHGFDARDVAPREGVVDSAVRRFAWARGLSAMRERQQAEVSARVVLGGRIGTAGGYLGRMPGVLEEALLTIRARQPIYVLGAFGGSARAIADALDGLPRRELTWAYHRVVPYSQELRELYAARGLAWDEYEAVADELGKLGWKGLHNGLSVEENRELAKSRSVERITELVLRGLGR